MLSPTGERAVSDALAHGRAILKFISPNDVGLTGSHQAGFYLPMGAWCLYSPNPPEKGKNAESLVSILWQDGRVTESCVKWYGCKTRNEFRLTRFGRDFPWLAEDNVGNLLVIIPKSLDEFLAYVLYLEDDIEEIQAALGVEVIETWGVYEAGKKEELGDETACINKRFREFTTTLTDFPPTKVFSEQTLQALQACITNFDNKTLDDRLIEAMDAEYNLFKMAERYICGPMVQRIFKSVDDFLQTASSILNRRKVRAGLALEHHVEHLLSDAGIPFEMQPSIDGNPDVVIPSKSAYDDPVYPDNKLIVLGIKTTCKERWRQVLDEAKRIARKHLLTIQPGISCNQLAKMEQAQITLIVPERLHRMYPGSELPGLLTFEAFIASVRTMLA